jgi:hypothetical protein
MRAFTDNRSNFDLVARYPERTAHDREPNAQTSAAFGWPFGTGGWWQGCARVARRPAGGKRRFFLERRLISGR